MIVSGPFADSRVSGTNEWLTPRSLIETLGPFDLDPCAPPKERRPWDTAALHFDETMDGLSREWSGFVWCNPPYGKHVSAWLERCAKHGRALALVNARTDATWFHEQVMQKASAILFWKQRIRFCESVTGKQMGNPAAPSVFVAYGDEATERLRRIKSRGSLIVRQR